jgi:hypothetical protein
MEQNCSTGQNSRVVAPRTGGGGELGGAGEDARRECNFSQQEETYPSDRLKGRVDNAAAGFLLLVAVAFPPLHLQPH